MYIMVTWLLLLLSLLVSGVEVNNQVTLCYTNEVGCSGYAWVDLSVAGSGSNIVEELHPATAAAVRLPFEFPFKMLSFVNDAMCNTCDAGEYVSVNTSSAVRLPVYATGTGMLAFQNTLWDASADVFGFRFSQGVLGEMIQPANQTELYGNITTRYRAAVMNLAAASAKRWLVVQVDDALDWDCMALLQDEVVDDGERRMRCLLSAQVHLADDGGRAIILMRQIPQVSVNRSIGFIVSGHDRWVTSLSPGKAAQLVDGGVLLAVDFPISRSSALLVTNASSCIHSSISGYVWVPSAAGGAGACVAEWLADTFYLALPSPFAILPNTTSLEMGPCYSQDSRLCVVPLRTPSLTSKIIQSMVSSMSADGYSEAASYKLNAAFPWRFDAPLPPQIRDAAPFLAVELSGSSTPVTISLRMIAEAPSLLTFRVLSSSSWGSTTQGMFAKQQVSPFCRPPFNINTRNTSCPSALFILKNVSNAAQTSRCWSLAFEYFYEYGVVGLHSFGCAAAGDYTMTENGIQVPPLQIELSLGPTNVSNVIQVGTNLLFPNQSLYVIPSYNCATLWCVHGTCNMTLGTCLCHPGWMGKTCEQLVGTHLEGVLANRVGFPVIAEDTHCYHNGTFVTMRCVCPSSFHGDRCEYYVPAPSPVPLEDCLGQPKTFFSNVAWTCVCDIGFVGHDCARLRTCNFTADNSLLSDPITCASPAILPKFIAPSSLSSTLSPTFGMGEWTRTSALVAGVTIATVCVLMSLTVQCMCLGFCTCRDEELEASIDDIEVSLLSPVQGCARLLPPPVPPAGTLGREQCVLNNRSTKSSS